MCPCNGYYDDFIKNLITFSAVRTTLFYLVHVAWMYGYITLVIFQKNVLRVKKRMWKIYLHSLEKYVQARAFWPNGSYAPARRSFKCIPHRQCHTVLGLLDSWAALPNSNPIACMPMHGGSLYHFYDGLWYDPAERRTHDLPWERRARYRLSQSDTVGLLNAYSRNIREYNLSLS